MIKTKQSVVPSKGEVPAIGDSCTSKSLVEIKPTDNQT